MEMTQEYQEQEVVNTETPGFIGQHKSEIVTGGIALLVGAALGAVGMYWQQKKSFDQFAEEANAVLDELFTATNNGFKLPNGEEISKIELLKFQIAKLETDPNRKLSAKQRQILMNLLNKTIILASIVRDEEFTARGTIVK